MRSIVRFVCLFVTTLTALHATAQNLWNESTDKHQGYFAARSAAAAPSAYKLMNLNASKLHQLQTAVPFLENSTYVQGTPFEMPMPDGSLHTTSLVETSLWADRSVNDAIGIKTYSMINPQTKAFE